MGTQFLVLMAGMVFGLVNFSVGGVELLPDFAGFLLIAFSCHLLSQYTAKFRVARNVAIPLTILSLLRYFLPALPAAVVFLISAILTIVLMWFVLAALIRFTLERDRPDLAENAVKYRRIYLGVAIVAFLFHLAAIFELEAARDFVALMAIAIMGVLALILRLLYVVRHDLALNSSGIA